MLTGQVRGFTAASATPGSDVACLEASPKQWGRPEFIAKFSSGFEHRDRDRHVTGHSLSLPVSVIIGCHDQCHSPGAAGGGAARSRGRGKRPPGRCRCLKSHGRAEALSGSEVAPPGGHDRDPGRSQARPVPGR